MDADPAPSTPEDRQAEDRQAEDAWRGGVAAGLAGRAASTNPHPADTDLALDWAGGWREGRHVRELRKPSAAGTTKRPSR